MHAVAVTVTLGDAERVGRKLPVGFKPFAVVLPEVDRVIEEQALPERVAVPQPLGEGERVEEAHTEAVRDTVGEAEEDRQREAVALVEGHCDVEVVAVRQPLAVTEAVPLPLTLGEREEEVHAVSEMVTLPEVEEDKQRDAVGLPLGLRVRDTDGVEHPLSVGETVLQPEVEGERDEERDAVGEFVPLVEPVEERHLEAVGLALVLREEEADAVEQTVGDIVSVPEPDAVGDRVVEVLTVGDTEELGEPVEERHLEVVGLTLAVSEEETVAVEHALGEGESVLEPEAVGERVVEAQAEGDTVPLMEPVEERHLDDVGLALVLREGDSVAVEQTLSVGESVLQPEEEGERDEEGDAVGETVPLVEPVEERHLEVVGLALVLREDDADTVEQTVGEIVSVPEPEAVGDRVAEVLTEGDTEELVEPVEERHLDDVGLPLELREGDSDAVEQTLGEGESVLQLEEEGERDEEGHTVVDGDTLADTEDERHLDVVGLALALREEVTVPEEHTLGEGESEPQPETVGDRVAEVLTEGETDTLGEAVEERHLDAVGLPLEHSVDDTVTVEQALSVGESELQGEEDGERVAEAHADWDGDTLVEPDEERQREGVAVPVGLVE